MVIQRNKKKPSKRTTTYVAADGRT